MSLPPGLMGSLFSAMGGGGAPGGAPLDLLGMVKMPACAWCQVAPSETLVLGTLVCADCADELTTNLRALLRFDARPKVEHHTNRPAWAGANSCAGTRDEPCGLCAACSSGQSLPGQTP